MIFLKCQEQRNNGYVNDIIYIWLCQDRKWKNLTAKCGSSKGIKYGMRPLFGNRQESGSIKAHLKEADAEFG